MGLWNYNIDDTDIFNVQALYKDQQLLHLLMLCA